MPTRASIVDTKSEGYGVIAETALTISDLYLIKSIATGTTSILLDIQAARIEKALVRTEMEVVPLEIDITKTVNNLVKIGEVDGNVMTFSTKIGDETVEGVTNFAVKDGKLFLDQLHLEGSSAGKVGRESLWNIAKDLGKQHNVKEVIIQGGRRTTGKYKGQIPSPITIKVD